MVTWYAGNTTECVTTLDSTLPSSAWSCWRPPPPCQAQMFCDAPLWLGALSPWSAFLPVWPSSLWHTIIIIIITITTTTNTNTNTTITTTVMKFKQWHHMIHIAVHPNTGRPFLLTAVSFVHNLCNGKISLARSLSLSLSLTHSLTHTHTHTKFTYCIAKEDYIQTKTTADAGTQYSVT